MREIKCLNCGFSWTINQDWELPQLSCPKCRIKDKKYLKVGRLK